MGKEIVVGIDYGDDVLMYEAACLEEAEWVNKRDYWGYIHRALAT